MAPNWFIAFPMQVEGLRLPPAPTCVRIFGAEDLHLTLCFFGAVQEVDAKRAWGALEGFRSFHPVEGTFERLQPLGHPRRPSALAALVAQGREPFIEMMREARAPLLAEAGAPPDDRPPLPHMTIARIQRRAKGGDRRAALAWLNTVDLARVRFRATDLALYTRSRDRQARLFDVVERHPMHA